MEQIVIGAHHPRRKEQSDSFGGLTKAVPFNSPELVTGREVGKLGASWEKKFQEPNFFLIPEVQ